MPVTAKLSRAFYERLGDEIANELVSWFNAVDLTYRTELRELNDLNFARFDAKVGERLAELRAELRGEMEARFARADVVLAERLAAFRAEMDARFDTIDTRFETIDTRFDTIDTRFDTIDTRFDKIDARSGKIDDRFGRIDDRFTQIEDRIRQAHVSTVKWMFVFWAGTGAMVLGWVVAR